VHSPAASGELASTGDALRQEMIECECAAANGVTELACQIDRRGVGERYGLRIRHEKERLLRPMASRVAAASEPTLICAAAGENHPGSGDAPRPIPHHKAAPGLVTRVRHK